MLSSTKEKRKPPNDEKICARGWKSPKEAQWFHRYKEIQINFLIFYILNNSN